MNKGMMALGVAAAGLLAACGQQVKLPAQDGVPAPNSVAAYRDRPELQDADSQAILARYADHPGLLAALQTAYGERPPELAPATRSLGLSEDRLSYIKVLAWGGVPSYDGQYASFSGTPLPYAGLDWTRDGCSAPDGLGLGYREDFRPACNVHDFGYRNLKVWERTDANRKATDQNFHHNMDGVCAAKSWYKRPACYVAAFTYYEAVRTGGIFSF